MGSNFRTSTPMADWRSIRITHVESQVDPYEEGKLYKIGDTIGVLFLDVIYDDDGCKKDAEIKYDADTPEKGVLVYHIEKVMLYKDHETGDDFGVGDKVYWSGTQGDPVTPNWTSGYYWIGIATEPAAFGALMVEVDLKGDKATIGA